MKIIPISQWKRRSSFHRFNLELSILGISIFDLWWWEDRIGLILFGFGVKTQKTYKGRRKFMLSLKEVGNFLRGLPVVASMFAKKENSQEGVCKELCNEIIEDIERRLEMLQAFLFKQRPEYDERKILYHGWIKAFPEQRQHLKALGVQEIEWREDYFSCICGKAAMEALMLGFPTFWPGCFTACIDDEQLPHGLQEYWHYPNTLVIDDYVVDGKWKCPRCDAIMKVERLRCGNCMAYRTSFETDYP